MTSSLANVGVGVLWATCRSGPPVRLPGGRTRADRGRGTSLILVHANLLVYAVHMQFAAHSGARAWLDDRLNGTERVGLPWGSLLAFLRLSTNPRAMSRPMPLSDAMGVVRAWLGVGVTWTPQPTERHAALAIEHGLLLCSTDRDFARFEGLRWHDPLRG